MYSFVLPLHSINRYILIVLFAIVLFRAYRGWFQQKQWENMDRKASLFLTSFLDVQLLLGLLLYFTSPITTAALKDFGGAMQIDVQRFFAMEHLFFNVLTIVIAHIGSSRAKKAATDVMKHKTSAIFFTISIVLILLGLPWSPVERWLPF